MVQLNHIMGKIQAHLDVFVAQSRVAIARDRGIMQERLAIAEKKALDADRRAASAAKARALAEERAAKAEKKKKLYHKKWIEAQRLVDGKDNSSKNKMRRKSTGATLMA